MVKRVLRGIALLAGAFFVVGAVSSCIEGADAALGDCPDPDYGHLNRFGDLDPCCKDQTNPCFVDGGLSGPPGPPGPPTTLPKCDGRCLPFGPKPDWDPRPVMVWHGLHGDPIPMCPQNAMAGSKMGRDPLVPNICPLCECSDPSCILPEGLIADGAPGCQQPVPPMTPFTPFPPEPDGSCSNKASFNPNEVQSIAVLPPTVSKCVGSMAPAPKDITADEWNEVAVVCYGERTGACDDPDNPYCAPSAPPGFMQCVQATTQGRKDVDCPKGYPNKHIYYESVDWDVSCTPCGCSPPVGSACKAEVQAYTSQACTDASLIVDALVSLSAGPPLCVTMQANTPLRGMTEAWFLNEPGKCDSIQSVPTGMVKALDSSAWEFCCVDPDIPDVPDPGQNP